MHSFAVNLSFQWPPPESNRVWVVPLASGSALAAVWASDPARWPLVACGDLFQMHETATAPRVSGLAAMTQLGGSPLHRGTTFYTLPANGFDAFFELAFDGAGESFLSGSHSPIKYPFWLISGTCLGHSETRGSLQ